MAVEVVRAREGGQREQRGGGGGGGAATSAQPVPLPLLRSSTQPQQGQEHRVAPARECAAAADARAPRHRERARAPRQPPPASPPPPPPQQASALMAEGEVGVPNSSGRLLGPQPQRLRRARVSQPAGRRLQPPMLALPPPQLDKRRPDQQQAECRVPAHRLLCSSTGQGGCAPRKHRRIHVYRLRRSRRASGRVRRHLGG